MQGERIRETERRGIRDERFDKSSRRRRTPSSLSGEQILHGGHGDGVDVASSWVETIWFGNRSNVSHPAVSLLALALLLSTQMKLVNVRTFKVTFMSRHCDYFSGVKKTRF